MSRKKKGPGDRRRARRAVIERAAVRMETETQPHPEPETGPELESQRQCGPQPQFQPDAQRQCHPQQRPPPPEEREEPVLMYLSENDAWTYRCERCGEHTTLRTLRKPVVIYGTLISSPRELKNCPKCDTGSPVLVNAR